MPVASQLKMSTRTRHQRDELFGACEAGDIDRLRRVIADGVDPKKVFNKDLFDETPLHTACRYSLSNTA